MTDEAAFHIASLLRYRQVASVEPALVGRQPIGPSKVNMCLHDRAAAESKILYYCRRDGGIHQGAYPHQISVGSNKSGRFARIHCSHSRELPPKSSPDISRN